MSYITQMWPTIRERLASLWKFLVVYPGIGAASAQGLAAAIGLLSPLWGFPPCDKVQELAYLIGYFVGLCYWLVVVGARCLRRTPQKQMGTGTSSSQPACACSKCCRCKPAGS